MKTFLFTIAVFLATSARGQVTDCPDLRGNYIDEHGNILRVEQQVQSGRLIYTQYYQGGGSAEIRVGSHSDFGQSTTKTYCENGLLVVYYRAAGIIRWESKNRIFPSDVANEGQIGALVGRAKNNRQDLYFTHDVYYRISLESKSQDFVSKMESEILFQNSQSGEFSKFNDRSLLRLRKI